MEPVDTARVLREAVDLLEAEGIDYMLIGGIAAGIWGEPRHTLDADFVVLLPSKRVIDFLRAAQARGFEVDEQVVLMNLDISGATRLPFHDRYADLIVGETEYDRAALDRRRAVTLYDRRTWVASPEDVILYKIVAMRDRDLDDIRRIVVRQKASLDLRYLEKWSAVLSEKLGNPGIETKLRSLLAEELK